MEEFGEVMELFSQCLKVGLDILMLRPTVVVVFSQLRHQFVHVPAQITLGDGALRIDRPEAGTIRGTVTMRRRDTDSNRRGWSTKAGTSQRSGRQRELVRHNISNVTAFVKRKTDRSFGRSRQQCGHCPNLRHHILIFLMLLRQVLQKGS